MLININMVLQMNKAKLYRINTKINKLKAKDRLTEHEKVKLAELYALQCVEQIYLGLFPGGK